MVVAGGAGSVTESHETIVGVHSPSLPHLTCHQLHKETRMISKMLRILLLLDDRIGITGATIKLSSAMLNMIETIQESLTLTHHCVHLVTPGAGVGDHSAGGVAAIIGHRGPGGGGGDGSTTFYKINHVLIH